MPRSSYQPRHARRSPMGLIGGLAAAVLVLTLLIWMAVEPGAISVENRTIVNPALSEDVRQLRLLYVSDIHQASWPFFSRTEDLVSRINAQKPDLVIFGGDYAMDSDGAINFFRYLPQIRAVYGVYAVMGECDRTLPESNLYLLKSAMMNAGVTPVVNEVVPVRIGTKNIYIAGVDDVSTGSCALKQVAAQCDPDQLTIFVCHNPSVIPDALSTAGLNGRQSWFDLGLFGHTHGGQIAMLGGLLGVDRSENRYRSGWYNPNRVELLVSRGVGTCGLPFRFLCAPQLHMITIKSKN